MSLKEEYTNLKELRFEKAQIKYTHIMKRFQTFQPDLLAYLKEDSLRNQSLCVGITYLAFDECEFSQKSDSPTELTLLGYITILNDSISLNGKLKRSFVANGVGYHSLPALKIGRLCVDDRYRKRGIGKLLLAFCIQTACRLNICGACRFITLEAKRNSDQEKDSLHFYKRLGFDVLEHKDTSKDMLMKQNNGSTPMFLDLFQIIKK
jgi:GNAT superfamily N-acetyltransferase